MFGFGTQSFSWYLLSDYLNIGTIFIFTIAILGSTRFFERLSEFIRNWNESSGKLAQAGSVHLLNLGTLIFVISILALSTIFLEGETISSFIYFKF
jgi:hypothetical protein